MKNTLTLITHFLQKSILFLFNLLIAPKTKDEDTRRHEFLLNTILLASIVFITLLDISAIWNHFNVADGLEYGWVSILILSTVLSVFIIFLIASRKGRFRTATYGVILIYFAGTTYGVIRFGMSLPAGLLSYALIIIMSSVLVSSRASLITSTIISAIIIYLAHVESKLGIIASWKQEPTIFTNGIQYTFFLLAITVLSWIASREIEKSLTRARKSEKDLLIERDLLEIKVKERTEALRHAEAERMSEFYRFAEFGRLSSGLFHDLMNPLSAVALGLKDIDDKPIPELEPIKEHIDRTVNASKRMQTFMHTIKRHIGSNMVFEECQVHEIIRDAVSLFTYRATRMGVKIEYTYTEKINIFGIPVKIQQMAANLIANALDAYEGQNFPAKRKLIRIHLKKEKDTTCITVKDEASGIDEEVLPHIFDAFFTTKSRHGNTGLGLMTTKAVIEKDFKGTITVESKIGVGTTFTIHLPIQQSSEPNE